MSWRSVRGHDQIVERLRTGAKAGRLAHAFLFVGPEGVGKRTFALKLSQALLCEKNPEALLDPCGACPGCAQVEAGTHPDVITAGRPEDKQELPIKVIREVCANFALKPVRGLRKVAIVDDLDAINDEAANAFLKTLEEPPPGAVLILLGTSPELQLETIVSRCQVIRFDPIPEEDLVAVLLDKGIVADETEARRLASLADGGVGRAMSLADPELDAQRRALIDGLADERGFDPGEQVQQFLSFAKQAGKEAAVQRRRAGLMIGEIARLFRGVLWQTAGLEAPAADPADRRAIATLASRLEPEDVFVLADRALEADRHLRRNLYLPVVLESLFHDLAKIINPKRRG